MAADALCPCGRPLHYATTQHRRWVEQLIADLGASVKVTVGERSWMVPRHYIALHGLKGAALPHLGFPEVAMRQVHAPFTDAQIARLTAWQHRADVHPFTCGRDSRHKVLVATREGWVCEDCDYRQDWAHAIMLETP
jgi:hypothetical protein